MAVNSSWSNEDFDQLKLGKRLPWSRLLEELHGHAKCFGHHYALSPADIDEVYGDVLVLLVRDDFRKLRSCRAAATLGAYLRRICRDSAAQLSRRPAVRRAALYGILPPSAERSRSVPSLGGQCPPARRTSRPALHRVCTVLTPAQFEVCWLRLCLGWSWGEIAKVLGVSRDAARKIAGRALATLASSQSGN